MVDIPLPASIRSLFMRLRVSESSKAKAKGEHVREASVLRDPGVRAFITSKLQPRSTAMRLS